MHNETLASEIIEDIQNKRHGIIVGLECMDADFEKVLFSLNSARETLEDMRRPRSLNDGLMQYANTKNALMLLSIAFDYVTNLQTSTSEIIGTYYRDVRAND